jgi:predicted metal-dependent hydrolase
MSEPLIVMIGQAAWVQAGKTAWQDARYTIVQPDEGSYMKTLIDQRAALIVVDGALPDWSRWTSVPKSSSSTRRIPILLVSDDANQRATALKSGADFVVSVVDFEQDGLKLAKDYARIPDAAYLDELDCECEEALPPRGVEGVAKFNAGEYYAQHDLFEAQWASMTTPVRDLYRAILQVGVAYYQIERGNYRGALKMLQRSVQWLLILPDVCQKVNVKKLRDDSFAVRAELERLGEARFSAFDKTLIKPLEVLP